MRILLLTISYPPVLNSTARLFGELAAGLAARGHEVTVLTTFPERYFAGDAAQAIPRRERVDGIEVHRLKNLALPKHVPFLRGLEHIVYGLQYLLRGRRLERHDAVIAYSPPLPLGITAIRLAHQWRGICIVNVQDLYPHTAIHLGLLKSRLLIQVGLWMERWVYKHADAITVHSEGNRDHVLKYGGGPDRVHVIPNWIDLGKYRSGPKENSFRERHGLRGRFVLSYAGVMGFAQGVGDLLRAAVRLEREVPGFSLVLAGEGVELPKLKRLSRELGLKGVRFIPHLPEEEYIELLQASDACLVTLVKDLKTPVVPGKLQCIMAVGRPAICSVPSTSDARRIVEESRGGLWVEAGNPDQLAEAVLKLHRDPTLMEEMGENARRYAENHFDRERCIEQYNDLISRLCKA
ncbi:glycosyltransferase family 4 protein [Candidatus Bipolaricaulota sp. J31]